MAISPYFHHKTIRRLVVAFATLFNGYQIQKPDSTMIDVPIRWASKQKWYSQLKENAEKDNLTAVTLPRMGFVISDISYDFVRKTSSLNKIVSRDPLDPDKLIRTFSPVPYRIDFDLFIATRTIDEGLQLIEQIIPFFTPSFNITITEVDELGVERDIPIKLNTITPDLKTEGSFDGEDIKLWDLNFTMEVNLYKNISSAKIIKKVIVDTYPTSDVDAESLKVRYKAEIDPETAYIDDEYSILESIGLVDSDTPKLP